MDFKERIFQARKAKGFSQEELAEAVGVSRQAVSKWETGEAMPDTEKLVTLCHALELDMEYLALGKESTPHVQEIKKSPKWMAVLLAAVCFVSGLLIGYLLPVMEEPTLLDTIEISQVTVTHLEDALPAGSNQFEIAIYPNQMPEGLAMAVMYGQIDKPGTKICSRDEDCFRVTLTGHHSFHYRISVLLTLDGEEKQVRILDVYGDETSFKYDRIS